MELEFVMNPGEMNGLVLECFGNEVGGDSASSAALYH